MRSEALDERHALADTLAAAGPEAPTLCHPWRTAELAAHLVLRDSTPVELLAQTRWQPLQRLSQAAVRRYAGRTAYPDLVQRVRAGAPRFSPAALPPVREVLNLLEFVVHHEDVRRAAEQWSPRELSEQRQQAVWDRLGLFARGTLRAAPVGVRLEWPGHGSRVVKAAARQVSVRGEPVELALFAYGRQRVARVTYAGDADAVRELERARISV